MWPARGGTSNPPCGIPDGKRKQRRGKKLMDKTPIECIMTAIGVTCLVVAVIAIGVFATMYAPEILKIFGVK
jgi:hypothetical protein